MTFGYAVGFAGLLTVGPHATAVVVAAGIWTQCSYRPERRTPMDLRRALFSTAAGVITVESAGLASAWCGGIPGAFVDAAFVTPLAASALVYFFVNTMLVAGAVALVTRTSLFEVRHQNFLWSGPSISSRRSSSRARRNRAARSASRHRTVGLCLALTYSPTRSISVVSQKSGANCNWRAITPTASSTR